MNQKQVIENNILKMCNTDSDKKMQVILDSLNRQIGGMIGYHTKVYSNFLVAKRFKKLSFKEFSVTEVGKINYLKINVLLKNDKILITVYTRWYFGILALLPLVMFLFYAIDLLLRRTIGTLLGAILLILFNEIYSRITIYNRIKKALDSVKEHKYNIYKIFIF